MTVIGNQLREQRVLVWYVPPVNLRIALDWDADVCGYYQMCTPNIYQQSMQVNQVDIPKFVCMCNFLMKKCWNRMSLYIFLSYSFILFKQIE